MGIRLKLDHRRWLGICLLGACCVAGLSSQSSAQHNFVMRDGRMIPLVKSATEWGVILQDPIDNQDAVIRISAQQFGTIRDFNDNPGSPLKIIQVQQGAAVASLDIVQLDPAIVEVHPVFRFQGIDKPMVTTGQVLAKIHYGVTPNNRAKLWADHGYVEDHAVEGQPGVYSVRPIDPAADEVVGAEKIARDPRTQWAQANMYSPMDRKQISVGDPLFSSQWHLENIHAPQAWLIADGQDVLVGMYDDSCDVDHKDLRDGYIGVGQDATLSSNEDGYDDPRPKQPGEFHGTSVMGLTVARGNNIGVRGVAYQSRFTASRGVGSGVTFENVAGTYTFARQQNVDVHNNSWGYPGIPNPAVVEDAIELAFREGRNKGDLNDDDEDDPLGMVIVFATGNGDDLGNGLENFEGFELSTMPQVIGVGASDRSDTITTFSNYGEHQNVLAPGLFTVTTDNEDTVIADPGKNVGGFNIDYNFPDIEPTGSYTEFFSGTSASCPIVTGVAALILSQNPLLTASDVRLIIDHTADRVNENEAVYHDVTSHSLRYGYGRINAARAVEEANSSTARNNRTWPDRPADVIISSSQINWRQNYGTDDSGFLVVQSNSPFDFTTSFPQDGKCYSRDQLGCGSAPIESLPSGVSILAVGCELTCDSEEAKCEIGANQCVPITSTSGTKYFAIYARNSNGRYSFGVALDTDGNILGSGEIIVATGEDGGGFFPPGGDTSPQDAPAVTIQASPLNGLSPVTVNFKGNAVSEKPIVDSKTFWDFDIAVNSDGKGTKDDDVDETARTTTHQYIVPAGESRLFIARLTMVDSDGHVGSEEVSIQVDGQAVANGNDTEAGAFRVVVGTPINPNADLSEGYSPFAVMLNLDTDQIPGKLKSITWDLGDGKTANTLSVPHTYRNNTSLALRLPITATVTTTIAGTTASAVTTKLITVYPGDADEVVGRPHLPGTGAQGVGGVASPCGTIGMIPMLSMIFSLMFMRRRWV